MGGLEELGVYLVGCGGLRSDAVEVDGFGVEPLGGGELGAERAYLALGSFGFLEEAREEGLFLCGRNVSIKLQYLFVS